MSSVHSNCCQGQLKPRNRPTPAATSRWRVSKQTFAFLPYPQVTRVQLSATELLFLGIYPVNACFSDMYHTGTIQSSTGTTNTICHTVPVIERSHIWPLFTPASSLQPYNAAVFLQLMHFQAVHPVEAPRLWPIKGDIWDVTSPRHLNYSAKRRVKKQKSQKATCTNDLCILKKVLICLGRHRDCFLHYVRKEKPYLLEWCLPS